jgi:hypothetical protein
VSEKLTPWGKTPAEQFRDRHCTACLSKCACGKGPDEPHAVGCTHVCSHVFQAYNPTPTEDWVIEDTRTSGGEALFWGLDHRGYTNDLSKAGRYTHEEAMKQEHCRSTDRAHRLNDVMKLTRLTVDRDTLRIAHAQGKTK